MTIDIRNDLPAVRLESFHCVVGKPGIDLAVDRYAVVIIEADQFAELQGAGKRTGLVRNTFHKAAVAEKNK